MDGKTAARSVTNERHFLMNIVDAFEDKHGDFKPAEGMMTVAQQIAHVADTVSWFREGAFGKGFEADPEVLAKQLKIEISLEEAKKKINDVYDDWIGFLELLTELDLKDPLPDNPFFGNAPKVSIIYGNVDHTAHHRGALSVYARLCGITPKMVYM